MNQNKLGMAVKATTAALALGVASQASAIDLSTNDYDIDLYGFARFAASYDFDDNLGQFGGQAASYEALGDSGNDGHFGADANTSRVGLSVMTPQDVKIVIESDFDRDNSLTPRLRLAYGEYNGWRLGRDWSNYNSFVGNTAILDFDTTPGTAGKGDRADQIRYTTGPFSVSLEETAATLLSEEGVREPEVDGNSVEPGAPDYSSDAKSGLPALTGKFEDSQGILSYSAAALVHQVEYDEGDAGGDDSALGFAAFLAGKIQVTDMMTIQGALNYTDGANSYLYRSGEDFGAASAYIDGSGDVETISGYGGTIGAGFDLGNNRSINIGYGIVTVDWDDAEDEVAASGDADLEAAIDGQSESNSAIMANYTWMPVENVTMGVEYAYLERENVDGEDLDGSRLLFVGQYSF